MGIGGSKNVDDHADRVLVAGRPNLERCDNMITTAKYTIWTFLPVVRRLSTVVYVSLHSNSIGVDVYIEQLR
jgi:hypothetical protein